MYFPIDTIELLQDLVEAHITATLTEKRAAKAGGSTSKQRTADDKLLALYNADKVLRVAWDDACADYVEEEEDL